MIYKTLHWYIFKELLRIFMLAASAMTTLLAFGGTFKSLTKAGLDVTQLLRIMLELMPAMLAYSIPLAALFAAVQVYWRMSTDNEIIACRAGGISFGSIVLPALILGVSISLTDFVFVNYLVPVFLQRVERLGHQDLGALLAFNISHQEAFKCDPLPLVVYADNAQLIHEKIDGVDRSTVVLNGLAATPLNKDGKPSAIIVAQQAYVHFDDIPDKDEVDVWVGLKDGAVYHPVTFQKFGGSIDRIPPDAPYQIPSMMRARPKFANLDELGRLAKHPNENPDIAAELAKMSQIYRYQQIAQNCRTLITKPGQSISFKLATGTALAGDFIVVHLPAGEPLEKTVIMSPEQELSFAGMPNAPLLVDQYRNNKLRTTYRCDSAALHFNDEEYPVAHVSGMLELHGTPVMRKDWLFNTPETPADQIVPIQPLVLPDSITVAPVVLDVPTIQKLSSEGGFTRAVQEMMENVQMKVRELLRLIESEKHSRGSFAVSCLTLVLLGAALGILLRGRNPLAVFVVGFVPAILLVLLITAGRRMAEWSDGSAPEGYMVIWAGNVILVVMVTVVYGKLLRQ